MRDHLEIYNLCTNPPNGYEKINKEFDVDGAIWEQDEILYISFQHSNSKRNWVLNFSTWKSPYSNMEQKFYVHYGFINAYKSVRRLILDSYIKYSENVKKERRVVVAGYSFGGALAKLCYEDFFWRIENDENMKDLLLEGYSIGAPSVFSFIKGKKEIERRMSGFISIANGNDIVTKVPPLLLLYFREVKDIIVGKRNRFIGFLFPSAVYHHHWLSYEGHIKDNNFSDNSKNNPVYKKSIFIYCAIYTIISTIITLLILSKF